METLADYLRHDLDILVVGLNPSLNSVKAGFYFATKQNRFWPALNGSRLFVEPLEPGIEATQWLLEQGIGFTDVVKRPSRGVAQLRADDYRRWSPVLREKLETFCPRIAWFHGKIAYEKFLKFGYGRSGHTSWGAQPEKLGDIFCFVSPNPSPANASYSLQDIISSYDTLAQIRAKMART
jgi:TDG/mug DNA glycosylase family protein